MVHKQAHRRRPARTAAVVVDWRRPRETLNALNSLANMVPSPEILICIENGCTTDDVAAVRHQAPRGSTIVETTENIGFAAAVNLGIDIALRDGAEWILLLNNDAVVARNCLERCIEEADRYPNVAAAGPAIAFADRPEKLWYGGGEVNSWFAYTRHRGLLGPSATPPPSSQTGFVTGCCMLLSGEAWRQVGPFRGDFFAYYEDAEWCLRARAAGWTCRYVGEVLCTHEVGVSSSQRNSVGLSVNTAYFLARNPLRFALETKNWARRLTRILGVIVVWNTYNGWRLVRSGKASVASAYLAGMIDAFRGRMGARKPVPHVG